jgi:hypothetical protein
MYSKQRIGFIAVVLLLFCLACAPALYLPGTGEASRSGVPADTLMMGRKAYIQYCGGCHNLYLPSKYTAKEWENLVPSMQSKANCSAHDTELMLKYLKAGAARND